MPAAALVPKNTSKGPSSMASFAASAAPLAGALSCGIGGLGSGCCGIFAVEASDGAGEVFRIESMQIVDPFADADGVDGQAEALGDGDKNAAARRTIELGHD